MIDKLKTFTKPLLDWFDTNGRKNLPWTDPRSAYRIWIAEVMLQQTQVKTVIPYFNRFMDRFPDIWILAQADEDTLLAHWSGLGYYTRARNIYKTAQILISNYEGVFPSDTNKLIALPGIGASTAAAIASQAFNLPTAILDGNVKRVLCRYFLIEGWPEQTVVKKHLLKLAQQCMCRKRCADYTQAIMDFGALCCTRAPDCKVCPLQETCLAYSTKQVTSYPIKRTVRTLPTKQKQFLLLYTAEDKIYLEKRPPSGLWGGLWATPIIDMKDNPSHYLTQTYGFQSLELKELQPINHRFSHFKLLIKSLAIHVLAIENSIAETNGKWFKLNEINQLGLATPIKQIIDDYVMTLSIRRS